MFKGRKFLLILLLGLGSLLLLASVSIPISFKTTAFVPYNLAKTMEQFTEPRQLGKWVLPFAQRDSSTVTKTFLPTAAISSEEESVQSLSANAGHAILAFTVDGVERQYDFYISQDPKKKRACIVTLPITNTLWKRMIDPNEIDDLVIRSVKNLNDFTNDTRKFYGYSISEGVVSDSVLLYITTAVSTDKQYSYSKILFDSLVNFARNRKLVYNGNRYFNTTARTGNQWQLTASIGINSFFNLKSSDGLSKKKMAYGKKQLVASYKGAYKDIGNAYKALDQYRRDYAIVTTEMPQEEFISAGYGYLSTDTVNIRLCIPLF